MDNRNKYSVIFLVTISLAIVISWPHMLWFSLSSLLICILIGFIALETGIFMFKSPFRGFIWGVAAIFLFGLLCAYKSDHLYDPLKIFDFILMFDYNNWNNDLLGWEILILLGSFIVFSAVSVLLFFYKLIKYCFNKQWLDIGRVVAAITFFSLMINVASGFHKFHLFESTSQGYLPYFIYSAFQVGASAEVTGNSDKFKNLFEKEKLKLVAGDDKKPDIIAWLHEATVNPDIFCEYSAFEKLPLFKENAYAKELGWLRVHTHGGGTWLSEFAFLTGLTSYDFGAQRQAVYYVVTPRLQDSFVKNLKASGYHTIALIPQRNKNFYNGESAYRDFGFDEIVSVFDLNANAPKWRTPDDMIKEAVVKLWKKHAHHPTFIFTLSVSQHSPFFSDYPQDKWRGPLDESKATLDIALKGRMQDYWSRLPSLSQAMEDLEKEVLTQKERKVILTSFGDHHPDFDYDRPSKKRTLARSYCGVSKLAEPQYLTYFKVQDNFSENVVPKDKIFQEDYAEDLSFLGGKLLLRAGLKASPFFRANQVMYQLCKGKLNDCSDQELLKSYKSYIYKDLKIFDEQNTKQQNLIAGF